MSPVFIAARTTSPVFVKVLRASYQFELTQPMAINVYDVDPSAHTTVRECQWPALMYALRETQV